MMAHRVVQRAEAPYEDTGAATFGPQPNSCKQYANLYFSRLASLMPQAKEAAHAQWGSSLQWVKTLDAEPGKAVVAGTVYKEMSGKPNPLKEEGRDVLVTIERRKVRTYNRAFVHGVYVGNASVQLRAGVGRAADKIFGGPDGPHAVAKFARLLGWPEFRADWWYHTHACAYAFALYPSRPTRHLPVRCTTRPVQLRVASPDK